MSAFTVTRYTNPDVGDRYKVTRYDGEYVGHVLEESTGLWVASCPCCCFWVDGKLRQAVAEASDPATAILGLQAHHETRHMVAR